MMTAGWSWEAPVMRRAPKPWGAILGLLGVMAYGCLAFLGWASFAFQLQGPEGRGAVALSSTVAAVGVGSMATICLFSKARGWWMIEWVALWFLMSSISVHAFIGVFGSAWPEWVFAQIYFLIICGHRAITLGLFSRSARWGVTRRYSNERDAEGLAE